MKIMITESQYRILTEQYSEEQLKTKYVDSELIPQNQFNEILKVTKKPFYRGWLLDMVYSGFIKNEDVYKFEHYFKVFDKFKQHYPIKDLGQIKTIEGVDEFEKKSKDIIIKQQDSEKVDTASKENLVSTNNIQKLESVGVKYLSMVDGYQSFQVPPEVKDSKETWNMYREILGRCSGRDKGQLISICTMAGFLSFQNYLNWHRGSSYYVFYNMGDSLSPYQIHFETNQYMDKNNDPINDDLKFKFTKFLLKNNYVDPYKVNIELRSDINYLTDDEKKDLINLTNILNNYLSGAEILDMTDPLAIKINENRSDRFKSLKLSGFGLFNKYYKYALNFDEMPKITTTGELQVDIERFIEKIGIEFKSEFKNEYRKILIDIISKELPMIFIIRNGGLTYLDEKTKHGDVIDKIRNYISKVKIINFKHPESLKSINYILTPLIKSEKLILNKDYNLEVDDIPMITNTKTLIFNLSGFIDKLRFGKLNNIPRPMWYRILFKLLKEKYPESTVNLKQAIYR